MFRRIEQYHQYDAYDKFEEISTLVKKTHMSFADPKHDGHLNQQVKTDDKEAAARNAWIHQSKNLINEVYAGMTKKEVASVDKF